MIEPWKKKHSRYLVSDQWLRLRADRCELADGREIEPFYVFEFPDWAVVLPITSSGELVLVRQYRHGIGQVLLELPGGIISPDEDALPAARRELREETGYGGGDWSVLGSASANPDSHTNLGRLFLARSVELQGTQKLDATENMEVVLMPAPEALARAETGRLFVQALHLSALFLASRRHPELFT
ncbi:MAG: NUDIX hydrolase [Spirochaetales bacterium]|nr:NUDIX hydrolase [Leptospiraceae bacterium]MCP5483290.1 NUDIX hydrolase [Spirochaetales bacterium]